MCEIGYNSTKKEYYYVVKLHVFASRHVKSLPAACSMMISPASQHDLSADKQIMTNFHPIHGGALYADKAYIDKDWEITLRDEHHVNILTPLKNGKRISKAETLSPHSSVRSVNRLNAFSLGFKTTPEFKSPQKFDPQRDF